MKKPENVIKGKIAEILTLLLLEKAGNRVYNFGANSLFEELEKKEPQLDRESDFGRKIMSLPDFIVITKNQKPVFVEVKFRTHFEALEEELLLEKDILEKFWEAKIILLTPQKPYFRILNPPYFKKIKKEGWPIPVFNWQTLDKDPLFRIEPKILKEFEEFVAKYFKSQEK
jgi:hypothetical protein